MGAEAPPVRGEDEPSRAIDLVFAKRRKAGGGEHFTEMVEKNVMRQGGSFLRLSDDAEARRVLEALAPEAGGVGLFVDYMGRSFACRDAINESFRRIAGRVVEDGRAVDRWSDKWELHQAITKSQLPVPYTVCWDSSAHTHGLDDKAARRLGDLFVVKPRRGSAGRGVSLNVQLGSPDVVASVERSGDVRPLLQRQVEAVTIGRYTAWLRIYRACGEQWVCFWDPRSHDTYFDPGGLHPERLRYLQEVMDRIEAVTGYTLFSTEIAITGLAHTEVLVIDAANHKPFMGTQSEVGLRGVPDSVAECLARRLAILSRVGPQEGTSGEAGPLCE